MTQVIIMKGDTLNGIAKIIDSTLSELLNLNPKIATRKNLVIRIGESINVPDTYEGRQLSMSRRITWNELNTKVPNNTPTGDWVVYQTTIPVKNPDVGLPATPTNNSLSDMFKNPMLLIGLGLLGIALFSRKR